MPAVSTSEQRQIFLACMAIFSGVNANIRKTKAIRAHMQKHAGSLRRLIPNYNIDRVLPIVKLFLEKGLFKSRAKAEAYFPGLFEPCPVRQTQNAVLEQEASRSNEEVLEVITHEYEAERSEEEEEQKDAVEAVEALDTAPDVRLPDVVKTEQGNDSDETLTPERPTASLFPLYLPYHAQHQILNTVQQVLEECIFDFMQTWFPDELASRGWDCAAAAELTKSTRFLVKCLHKIPEDALHPTDLKPESILLKVVKIRHTAVHRLPTTARGVCELVGIAKKLTETLGDSLRTSQLENLHHDLQDKVQILEFNKNVLEENLSRQLKDIEEERELLKRREERLRAKTVEDDRENKLMMGLLLEESMEQIFRAEAVESEAEQGRLGLGYEYASLMKSVWSWLRENLAKGDSEFLFGIFFMSFFILMFVWLLVQRFMYVLGKL
ncbi:hypothetical protein ASPBRDRAFT_56251 [Aspergillus brasiliensis CBS 101740]|uniref:Ubiquinol-cytochrome-c reductase cytochrome c1 n=1 Tax=Aspergillus brasiliensis (strain CBS 101740 / IMI 381727 / IBT 21946) TaxID=767769 RepID=A0A1L9UFL1_ASPBC|nr:hypothetical protein ASPBRDRAFT_56251 [Aspergillus brasiliensis CBS 101740]